MKRSVPCAPVALCFCLCLGFFCPSQTLAEGVRTGVIPCLHLENSDLVSALGIISSYSGTEIIPSSTVRGTATLDLENVTWKEALDSLCQVAGLAPVQEDRYIFVLPRLEKSAFKPLAESKEVPFREELLKFRFTNAACVDSALRPLLSISGKLECIDSANSFRLTDSAGVIAKARSLLARLETNAMRLSLRTRLFHLDSKLREKLEWTKPEILKKPEANDSLNPAPEPGFRLAKLPTDDNQRKLVLEQLGAKIVAESTFALAGRKESSGFFGEPVTLQVVDSDGKHSTRILDPGLAVSISPVCRDNLKVSLNLGIERRSFLIDPAIGVVPNHEKGEFAVDTDDGLPILVGSFCEGDGSDLVLLLDPQTVAK